MAETVPEFAVAAAAAAAAAPGAPYLSEYSEEGFSSTQALVAFLRMEADLAEEKAKRLRDQATALALQFSVTETLQQQYELPPDQLPPLDEHGVPKYKGKKRGRKPKYRKRKANPNRRKRQHTAYTLYVQETYPGIKAANPELPSKDVISIVAKQWADGVSPEQKKQWKERAKATHEDDDVNGSKLPAVAGVAAAAVVGRGDIVVGSDDEEDEDEEVDVDTEFHEEEDETTAAAAAAVAAAAAAVDVEHDDEALRGEQAPLDDDSPAPPARRSKRAKRV